MYRSTIFDLLHPQMEERKGNLNSPLMTLNELLTGLIPHRGKAA